MRVDVSRSDEAGHSAPLDATIRSTLRMAALAALLVIVGLAGVVVLAVAGDRQRMVEETPGPEAMLSVAPGGVLDPADVPIGAEGDYLAARRHYEAFERVPCFCGCEEMLGHRHLGDCFIRADGDGLEAHALGCGVCLGEAQQVTDLIESGVTEPKQIRQAVVAEWGDPYRSRGEDR